MRALGVAQALALPASTRQWLWAVTIPVLCSLGWTITTLVGVDVESRYTVFGSTGAITFCTLSGVVLYSSSRSGFARIRLRAGEQE